MNKFSMTCTCGDVMNVETETKEEAITKMKAMMTPEMVQKHMTEKHPGEPVPSVDQTQAMIDQTLVAA